MDRTSTGDDPFSASGAESLFRLLAEHAAEGILVADSDDHRFVYANAAICALLGFSREELLDLGVRDIHPATALAAVLSEFEALARGEKTVARAVPCRRKDGSVFEVDVAALRVTLAGRRFSFGLFTDVTEKARAERALAEREEEQRLVLEGITEIVYRFDLVSGDPYHGSLGFISGNVQEALGLSAAELLADPRRWVALFHPDDWPAVEQQTRALLASGEGGTREYRLRHAGTGEYRWLEDRLTLRRDTAGRVVGFFGVARDMTARRQVESELRETARLLLESQRVARVGSYHLDIASGTWTGSPMLDEIFGIDPARFPRDVAGWASLLHPETREAMSAYFADEVIGRGRRFDREYRIVRPADGAVRWVHGRGELVLDGEGRPREMIGTIQDITERRASEDEKLELERRLLHAQKLESLGVLAGGIAHDFNNLLMSILGNLELAARHLRPQEGAAEFVRRATQAAERSADLTRQILAYSGRGATVSREIDLSRLVEENVHLLRAMIGKNVALELALDPDLPATRGDPAQLQQVVMNLITNGSEAIGARPGTIRLATGVVECDAAELARSRSAEIPPAGRFVLLEVEDDGCGMDPATQERFFDPFFSTKAMGRGLGTAAILGIVSGHAGAILVDSAVARGTRIRVMLPASGERPGRTTESPLAPAAGSAAPASGPRPGRTVLLADDEPAVLAVAGEMLRIGGFEVLTAGDGAAAVELYRREHHRIDCVVLDLSMPRLDGLGALREISRLEPAVCAVLASGYAKDDALRRFGAEPLRGFLQKPFTLDELLAAVEKALAG